MQEFRGGGCLYRWHLKIGMNSSSLFTIIRFKEVNSFLLAILLLSAGELIPPLRPLVKWVYLIGTSPWKSSHT